MFDSPVGKLVVAVAGVLFAEKLSMEYLVPTLVPTLEALDATHGRYLGFLLPSLAATTLAFWGGGSFLALPALLRVEKWKIQLNRSLDSWALLQALPLIAFNFLLGNVLAAATLCALLPEASFDWRRLPSTWVLARDAAVWILSEEVLFYYIHRWFHENKRMYAAVHKLHHTWTSPVSLVAIYCHPVEHILINLAPIIVGPLLCGSHLASTGTFLFLIMFQTTVIHSGYFLPGEGGLHDEHHNKFTVNYGNLGLLDTLHGTYQMPTVAGEGAGTKPGAPKSQ